MENKVTAYLSLGSNIDDRIAFLAEAESMLNANQNIELVQASKVYETEPWPKMGTPDDHPHMEKGEKWFLNQVIKIQTSLSPQELLNFTQSIEQKMGRKKRQHWGAREIDIDILLYGDEVIDLPELSIPHHHIEDRQFVLVPLLEIAPDLSDPMTGRPFTDILEEVKKKKDDHKVIPFL